MAFLRPEVALLLHRWRETAIYSFVTVSLLIWLWDWPLTLTWAAFLGVIALVGIALTRAALLTALSAQAKGGPGVVMINERRIAFLGPEGGGFASINEISAVSVGSPPGLPPTWTLWAGAEPLIIPAAAKGAEGIIDALSALPDFQATRAVAALSGHNIEIIWRRGKSSTAIAPSDSEA
ncbi:MAG: hypothetical protein ACPGGK_15765 [Pikeienuella sp.]